MQIGKVRRKDKRIQTDSLITNWTNDKQLKSYNNCDSSTFYDSLKMADYNQTNDDVGGLDDLEFECILEYGESENVEQVYENVINVNADENKEEKLKNIGRVIEIDSGPCPTTSSQINEDIGATFEFCDEQNEPDSFNDEPGVLKTELEVPIGLRPFKAYDVQFINYFVQARKRSV